MARELTGLDFLRNNVIKDKKYDADKPFAFISYSHDKHDSQIVKNIFKKMREKGYNLWIDVANIPHDENSWTYAAEQALDNGNCKCAIFFRSENSMVKDTIVKEIENIKELDHISGIIVVDIWENENIKSAKDARKNIVNSDISQEAKSNCRKICDMVNADNNAIRLYHEAENDIDKAVDAIIDAIKEYGIAPDAGKKDTKADGTSGHDPKYAENTAGTGKLSVNPLGCGSDTDESGQKDGKKKKLSKSADSISGKIGIPQFIEKWSGGNTKSKKKFEHSSYKTVRLVGEGEYAKYSTGSFDSCRRMVIDFSEKRIDEMGEDFIKRVNSITTQKDNLPFLLSEEADKKSVNYQPVKSNAVSGYEMNVNYSDYAFICKVLLPYINALGLPIGKFHLEFEPNTEQDNVTDSGSDAPQTDTEKTSSKSADSISGEIGIPDFIEEWSGNNTKSKKKFECGSYKTVRLVGKGDCEKYSTDSCPSCRCMVVDFAKKRIGELGEDFIKRANDIYAENAEKNPPFMLSEEVDRLGKKGYQLVDPSAVNGYKMYTVYSDFAFIGTVLKLFITALGQSADKFYLEFVPDTVQGKASDGDSAAPQPAENSSDEVYYLLDGNGARAVARFDGTKYVLLKNSKFLAGEGKLKLIESDTDGEFEWMCNFACRYKKTEGSKNIISKEEAERILRENEEVEKALAIR